MMRDASSASRAEDGQRISRVGCMGDGNTSSHRWQPNRHIGFREELWMLRQRITDLKADRDRLEQTCTKQALAIAKLNSLLVFKRGDEVA
jgi:hypothetical protein